jgi:hypothetical protein
MTIFIVSDLDMIPKGITTSAFDVYMFEESPSLPKAPRLDNESREPVNDCHSFLIVPWKSPPATWKILWLKTHFDLFEIWKMLENVKSQ